MVSRKINRAPSSIWHNPIHFVACGFGIGAMPIVPGTFWYSTRCCYFI